MTTENQIQSLHKLYTQTTGLEIPLPISQYWLWEAFIARGYTAADLSDVVKHLKRGIQNQERREGCLRFSTLIGDLDHFAEELAMARKIIRPKPSYPPQKAAALRATGRHDEPPSPPAESIGTIMERTKLAAMLAQWRTTNL